MRSSVVVMQRLRPVLLRLSAAVPLCRIRKLVCLFCQLAGLMVLATIAAAASYKATRRMTHVRAQPRGVTQAMVERPQLSAPEIAWPAGESVRWLVVPDAETASLSEPPEAAPREPPAAAISSKAAHVRARAPNIFASSVTSAEPSNPMAEVVVELSAASSPTVSQVHDVDEARPSTSHAIAPLTRAQRMAATQIELQVQGSLVAASVRRGIERIRPALANCYAGVQRDDAALRDVHLQFVIDETGHARSPQVLTSAPAFNDCVRAAIGKVTCSAPDTGTVQADLRIKFRP